jgi:hypothetical protein
LHYPEARRYSWRTRGCTGCLPTPEHICSRYQCGSSAPSAIRPDLGTSHLMTDGRFRITPTVQRCRSFLGCHARAQRPGYTIAGHALIRRTRPLTREQTFLSVALTSVIPALTGTAGFDPFWTLDPGANKSRLECTCTPAPNAGLNSKYCRFPRLQAARWRSRVQRGEYP